jgi:hypothetical protein
LISVSVTTPNFVGEVGVHHVASTLLDELDQTPDPSAGLLKHRQSDVPPPLVARELVEGLLRGVYDRNGGLTQECCGDVLDLLA